VNSCAYSQQHFFFHCCRPFLLSKMSDDVMLTIAGSDIVARFGPDSEEDVDYISSRHLTWRGDRWEVGIARRGCVPAQTTEGMS
jgi:hypothetical protein